MCYNLEALPANIGELSHLKAFRSDNEFQTLPDLPPSFWQLTALTSLQLRWSQWEHSIDHIARITQFKQLKRLDLYVDNFGGVFPKWICHSNFPALEDLSFCLGDSNSVPSSISNFSLTRLVLTSNSERIIRLDVPDSIGSLHMLRELVLTCYAYTNDLVVCLPISFSQLTALQRLEIITDIEGMAPL